MILIQLFLMIENIPPSMGDLSQNT